MSDKLQLLTKELLQDITASEISAELGNMISVYIQHAPVDRLQLSAANNIISRLSKFVHRAESEINDDDQSDFNNAEFSL